MSFHCAVRAGVDPLPRGRGRGRVVDRALAPRAATLRMGRRTASTVVCLAIWLLAACAPAAPWRQESYVFGTRVEILIAGLPAADAQAAAGEVLREFDRLHRAYHAWQPSELTTLNAALAKGEAVTVSAELAGFLREAQLLSAQSGGTFDPGIGALIALWGFQSDEMPSAPPATDAVDALLARRPRIADLSFDGQRVTSRNPAVAVDFGGYLKGVALDRAAAALRARGVRNALVNIGGTIIALGSKGGTPWRIGIQHPRPESVGGAPLASIELMDGEAIGTSGDSHRFFAADGVRYHHLLDPRSGRPATATQSATVLMPAGPQAGMLSDALSKPVFIAGDDWSIAAKSVGATQVLRVSARGMIEATAAMRARLAAGNPDLHIVLRD